MSNLLPTLTDTDLAHELQSHPNPVLVYFISAHCAPCKMLTPVVAQLAVEWSGEVRVVAFDILAHMLAALRYGVMSAPELILFKDGQAVARFHGYAPKQKLLGKFTPYL